MSYHLMAQRLAALPEASHNGGKINVEARSAVVNMGQERGRAVVNIVGSAIRRQYGPGARSRGQAKSVMDLE